MANRNKRAHQPSEIEPIAGERMHKRMCAAHNRRGEPCRYPPVPGRPVCRFHGGHYAIGSAHHSFKHGRYSSYLPSRLAPAFMRILGDTELLALRDDIALVETRIVELIGRIDTQESKGLVSALSDVHKALRAAVIRSDQVGVREGVERLGVVVHSAGIAFSIWDDIFKAVEMKRKLSESERERLMDMQSLITSEKAFALIGALLESVTRNVTDNATRIAIEQEFTRLIGVVRLDDPKPGREGDGGESDGIQGDGVSGV